MSRWLPSHCRRCNRPLMSSCFRPSLSSALAPRTSALRVSASQPRGQNPQDSALWRQDSALLPQVRSLQPSRQCSATPGSVHCNSKRLVHCTNQPIATKQVSAAPRAPCAGTVCAELTCTQLRVCPDKDARSVLDCAVPWDGLCLVSESGIGHRASGPRAEEGTGEQGEMGERWGGGSRAGRGGRQRREKEGG